MSTPPRFLLNAELIEQLATVDSSYGQQAISGRLALFVDYQRGKPLSVQVLRMPGGILSLKLAAMPDATVHVLKGCSS